MHAHIHASEVAAAAATAGAGIPLVLTEHTEGPWRRWWDRRAAAWAFSRAVRVVAVSSPVQRMLVEGYGVPPSRTALVHPGVSPAPAAAPGVAPPCDAGPTIGFVGRLVASKGVDVLLRALALLPTPARLLVIGDGPERAALERLARRLGVAGLGRFAGFRHEARALLPALDVLAVPSLTDGSPLVILEAMAAGLPVVGSAVGGIPDQVIHRRTGLLVPPGNPAALAAALARLLSDPPLRARIGAAARRRAADFSHGRMVDALERVYRQALREPTASPA